MFSRKQYMAKECTHQEYYSQFGRHLVNIVGNTIGLNRIKTSTDKQFNDIPLKEWDNLYSIVMVIVGRALAKANESNGASLSDCVCSAKAAAQMIRDGE